MASIKPKILTKIGFTDNRQRSLLIDIIQKNFKHNSEAEIISILTDLKENPENYRNNAVFQSVVELISPTVIEAKHYDILDEPKPFKIYGESGIDDVAIGQMNTAMSLPVSVAGALMSDGCAGYGLPIGGVLATENVVIPYAVGLDIACMMHLTITDVQMEDIVLDSRTIKTLTDALTDNTAFGLNGIIDSDTDDSLFDNKLFYEIAFMKRLREKAIRQLGSSGKGNHFVDIVSVEFPSDSDMIHPKKYLGILSHSGSRGFGAGIAEHYTEIAKKTCILPKKAGPFTWLDMDSEAGVEYWNCMELAGRYSKLNHETIHQKLMKTLRVKQLQTVTNFHNFAWKETINNKEVIVHRKGATPAHKGEYGIIPGSMATPGYIVVGKGNEESLFSASHGAGRCMSKLDARNSFSRHAMARFLKEHNVVLVGGSVEEHPNAYKNIEDVISYQNDLVDVVGKITPLIVRMSEDE